jgi:outer membrane phospholipase A
MTAQAQPTDTSVLSLQGPVQSVARAADVQVELVVLNTNSQPLAYKPPEQLAGTLQIEQRTWIVTLKPAQPVTSLTIAPGQFARIAYVFTLPGDASGRVQLQIEQVASVRVVVDIRQDQPPNESTAASTMATMKQQEAVAPPAASRIERSFASRFAFHEPMYFIFGSEVPAAKFQFSFKYRLIGENSKFGDAIPPFRGFYLAYTQRSLWDTKADSSPFYDTSYMPEMFFEWLAPEGNHPEARFHWLGMQTGLGHESNGKAGDESRSLNTAYLRAGMVLGSLTGWHMIVAPKVFSYLDTAAENADIKNYRGFGQLQLALAKNDNFQLSVATWLGSDSGKNSIQVDLTQPVRIPLIDLETYLQLQYFDGYGESLRTYNQKSSVWRLGIAFTR